jgi:catechol 2,3-dioxygenase-like lactoylglutathione lyase family enzyme
VAFIASRDLEVSGQFYGGVLGLEMVESSPFANVYDANGTQLRVTHVESLAQAPYTVLGWRVTDIAAAVGELRRSGVQFNSYDGMDQDENGVWTAPGGARIAWFADPDGNTLSLQQALSS